MTQLDLFSQPAEAAPAICLQHLLPPLLALVVELESLAEHVLSKNYMGEPQRACAIERQRVARKLRHLLERAA